MKKGREKTHERIARLFNAKPHYVQSILKIGDVNPEYFERLRQGRIALYVAYSACVKECRKEVAETPKDDPAVIFNPDTTDELVQDLKQVRTMKFTCNNCGTKHEIEIPDEDENEE